MANHSGLYHFTPLLGRSWAALLVLASLPLPLRAAQKPRVRVAVMNFDVSADARKNAFSEFGITDDLGLDLSDLLVDKLVNDHKFIVVERAELDKVLKEQNLSNSDRNDPATAARIGKVAGVQEIIIADVVDFGDQENKSSPFSILPGYKALSGLSRLTQHTVQVTVRLTGRLVDTSTGVVLAAANGVGSVTAKKTEIQNSTTTVDTRSSDFATSIVGQATTEAIDSLASQLEQAAAAAAPPPPVAAAATAPPPAAAAATQTARSMGYTGLVADVSRHTLILDVGSKGGAKVGDVLEISRPIRTVYDPDTHAVLKVISEKLGHAKITEVDPSSSTATYTGDRLVHLKDMATYTH